MKDKFFSVREKISSFFNSYNKLEILFSFIVSFIGTILFLALILSGIILFFIYPIVMIITSILCILIHYRLDPHGFMALESYILIVATCYYLYFGTH